MNKPDEERSSSSVSFRFDRPKDQPKVDWLLRGVEKIRENFDDIVVVKYGGAGMQDEQTSTSPLTDVGHLRQLGMCPVVVHGGGPMINQELKQRGIESTFIDGLRVTDEQTLRVTEMVLSGMINQQLTAFLSSLPDIQPVGISGKSGRLLTASKIEVTDNKDWGFVGEIESVNPEIIRTLVDNDFLPVISPLAMNTQGETLNVNADSAASRIAASLQATWLIFLSDTDGVLQDGKTIPHLSEKEAKKFVSDGKAYGGMVPKLEAAFFALEHQVQRVIITNGKKPHSLLQSIFGDMPSGTTITRS